MKRRKKACKSNGLESKKEEEEESKRHTVPVTVTLTMTMASTRNGNANVEMARVASRILYFTDSVLFNKYYVFAFFPLLLLLHLALGPFSPTDTRYEPCLSANAFFSYSPLFTAAVAQRSLCFSLIVLVERKIFLFIL